MPLQKNLYVQMALVVGFAAGAAIVALLHPDIPINWVSVLLTLTALVLLSLINPQKTLLAHLSLGTVAAAVAFTTSNALGISMLGSWGALGLRYSFKGTVQSNALFRIGHALTVFVTAVLTAVAAWNPLFDPRALLVLG